MNMSATNTLNWYAKALRPKDISIQPKALGVKLGSDVPTYWFDDNPFLTHFLTAFSALFPQGESFMIDSVRLFRDEVKSNAALHTECGGFIGQEAHHSREHAIINDFMSTRGIPVNKLSDLLDSWVPVLKGLPKKDQMAITGAAEHLTALFGDLVLSNPEVMDQVDKSLRPVWIWHAIEEIEHKAVTYDLFDAVDGNYLRRVYGYVIALLLVVGFSTYGTALFMIEDKKNFSLAKTAQGVWWMFGIGKKSGYLRKSFPALLDYLRIDYHPWKENNSDLIRKWRPELNMLLQA